MPIPPQLQELADRMGRKNWETRMRHQRMHEAGQAWQGKGLFKYEHAIQFPKLVCIFFKCIGLYERGHRNFLDIRVVENVIRVQNLPSAFDGFRILQIADLHTDLDPALPDAVIPHLHGLEYDICINTGDFRNRTLDSSTASMEATRRIYEHVQGPCYASLGNHDFIEKVLDLEAMGIRILLNESTPIEKDGQRIWLSGIDDAHFYQSQDVNKARASVPDDSFALMLSHTPQMYKEVAEADYDLMFSGHTHGGQVCLPGGYIISGHCESPRSMWRGAWQYEGMQGYTSPGTGGGAAPLRFNCPPELTIHILRSSGTGSEES